MCMKGLGNKAETINKVRVLGEAGVEKWKTALLTSLFD